MSLFNLGKNKLPAGVTKAKIEDRSVITPNLEAIGVGEYSAQIMANDGVNICSSACAVCWDTKFPSDYKGRSEYISKRTRIGHGSVTEHSNHVFYFTLNKSQIEDLVAVLDVNKYCHTKVKISTKYDNIYFIIGGSWRAFNYLIGFFSKSSDNSVLSMIKASVYQYCDESGFMDLIEYELISNKFNNVDMSIVYNNTVDLNKGPVAISDKLDCYGLDNINMLISMLSDYCPEPELFTIADMLHFCTCTILFKDMSRIITQQLTRHRNAITQESQRYVDYSKAAFNSPALYKENYDKDHQYTITFGRSSQKMNLQEIGDNITKIYGQLFDKEKLGKFALLKEDARGYLPSNVKCRKIFITFTWDNLFHFLRLREDKHAQAELRSYATDIGSWFAEQYPEFACLYRPEAGDGSWIIYPIPKKDSDEAPAMDKDSFIEAIENSMKTEVKEIENTSGNVQE